MHLANIFEQRYAPFAGVFMANICASTSGPSTVILSGEWKAQQNREDTAGRITACRKAD
jgi:hypothetical protein